MKFNLFLIDYLQTGQVSVARQFQHIDEAELEDARLLLHDLYKQDALNMPHTAPVFNHEAALWAASIIYYTVQLILIRDSGDEVIAQHLTDYKHEISPEAIYSADLLLRNLPELFRLSRGLSPQDPLVGRLKQIAGAWPFSSIGIEDIDVTVDAVILQHPSLKQVYIDRIISKKDLGRLKHAAEHELLKETLGGYQAVLWPNLALLLNETTEQ